MSLENRSNLRSTRLLNPLVQFVCNYTDNHELATVTIQDGDVKDQKGRPTYGGVATNFKKAYRAIISINPDTTYPRTQRLNLQTPEVRFESWEEEFVMVLAHELRHIDQFVLGAFRKGEDLEAEIDAEAFAAAVLSAWRKSGRGSRKAA